ncbi:MAG: hypothetical protein WC792_03555 [Candidatus Micrarchaeia archaeon]
MATDFLSLAGIAAGGGFFSGFHPCGFAVLVFFIAFLFTLKQPREKTLSMGASYIAGVFAANLLIGIGLFGALSFTDQPDIMGKIGAALLVLLGIFNIAEAFGIGAKFYVPFPTIPRGFIQSWIRRASLPTAFVAGVLVGICALPCAGSLYIAILGIIAASEMAGAEAMGIIFIYNIMFVAPLAIMLLLASNGGILEKLEALERENKKRIKLAGGLAMLAIGLALLFAVLR